MGDNVMGSFRTNRPPRGRRLGRGRRFRTFRLVRRWFRHESGGIERIALEYLIGLAARDDYEAAVPRIDGRIHPLHGVMAKSLSSAMEEALNKQALAVRAFLSGRKVRYVDTRELAAFDPSALSTFNINSPQDLEQARSIVLHSA